MSHPAIDTRENALYTKAMLLSVYMKPALIEIKQNKEFGLYNQLSRSIRSIKNCVNEAQSSESRQDFIHKLKIADKELHETAGMVATEYDQSETLKTYLDLYLELIRDIAKLLGRSIATAKNRDRGIT